MSEKVAKIKFKNNYEIQEYLGKSNRINREEKEVIKRYINYMLSNVEELRKMEIAEEIGRIKKRRVEMSEVIKIYNDIKNGMIKKEEESRFYNFYQNKVEIEQIVRELDQQQVRLNNIKEIRDEINVIKQTIVYYLK